MNTKLAIALPTIFKLVLFFITLGAYAGEFGVSPMYINFDSSPGQTHKFEITVSGKKKGKIRLIPYEMKQAESGHMIFIEDEKQVVETSTSSWIKLDKSEYQYQDDETLNVPVTVVVPNGEAGSKFATIMIEEVKDPRKDNGIGVKVRYAVIVNFNVINKRKPRVKLDIDDLDVQFVEGKLVAMATVKNLSDYQTALAGKMYIRDEKRHLVDKVPLNTKSSWERQYSAALIYPKGKVIIFGIPTKITEPGKYNISFRGQFGRKKVYKKSSVLITKAMLPTKNNVEDTQVNKVLSKAEILLKPDKNGKTFNVIEIKNPYDKEITVSVISKESYNWLTDLKTTPQQKQIKPGQKTVMIIKQKIDQPLLEKADKLLTSYPLEVQVQKDNQIMTESLVMKLKE